MPPDKLRRGNVILTVAIGSVAVALALGAFVAKRLKSKRRSKTQAATTNDGKLDAREKLRVPESFFSLLANSHVVHNATISEWKDDQLGFKVQFSPLSLALVHEERQKPVAILKFVSIKEPETTVQCVIEECSEHMSAEEYRSASISRICDVAKIHATKAIRIGLNVFPEVEYSYLSETDSIVNVVSVFVSHGNVCVAMQFCTPQVLPRTLPTIFHELVRSAAFFDPMQTPSYLFCAEPRLGVGFRTPLDYSIVPLGDKVAMDCEGTNACVPFATLATALTSTTIVARHEQYFTSWMEVLDQVTINCYERFCFCGTPNFVVQSSAANHQREAGLSGTMTMRACVIHVPTRDVDFGWCGVEAESTTRGVSGYCCFQEVVVDANRSVDIGFENLRGCVNAYFCVYCLAISPTDYISVSFLSPRTRDLQSFVQFCQGVVNSISLGNHYGQETSLSYCCMRHMCKFHVDVGHQALSVTETKLGDPVCAFRCNDHVVPLRIVPCPTDSLSMDQFVSDAVGWIHQLGGNARICSVSRRPLVSLVGELVFFTHEHDSFADQESDEEILGQNPFALSIDESGPSSSHWATALICCRGSCFLLQISSNQSCFPGSVRLLEEIVSRFTPF